MKKSELLLVWIGGLWAVVCLVGVALTGGHWGAGLAVLLAGWILCGLIFFTIRQWPRRDEQDNRSRLELFWGNVSVTGVGYVLALGLLVYSIHTRMQVENEREAIKRIVSGHFTMDDCHSLPEPLTSRCVEKRLDFVPLGQVPKEDLPQDIFDRVAREMWHQCSTVQAIFAPEQP